ncbi:hypothetical protein [Verrucomicrobium sp. BvORR106]|uniref:hypothetical protein n=1 Tax=Verrucomicrobium sp. BvORR106 TaxID=1403819 RepID=UPI002240EA6E|nr:hypothetical protein [Verrucomicrobium sp. BvORR106]
MSGCLASLMILGAGAVIFRPEKWVETASWIALMTVLGALGQTLLVRFTLRSLEIDSARQIRKLDVLGKFRFLLPRACREDVDLLQSDLKKDEREMIARGLTPSFINIVKAWHICRFIVPYLFDGALSLLRALSPLKVLLKIFGKG